MLSSPDPRITRPLSGENDTLTSPSTSLPTTHLQQLNVPVTATKLPLIIPASLKRASTVPLVDPAQPRRTFVLPGVLLVSLLIFLFGSLFVIPLDNGQRPANVIQTIGVLISTGQLSTINSLPQAVASTPGRSIGEGYCGGNDIWGTCATAVTASGLVGTGIMQRPVLGAMITQGFGHPEYQQWCGCWKPHTGIDLAAPYGSPITAADTGQVIWTGWDWSGLGWAVKINHGNYIATIYGHLERFIVRVGQNVTKGQIIGYEGSTGASTGPHLHFMVLVNNNWVNPLNYVQLP